MSVKRAQLMLLVICLCWSPLEASLEWDIHLVREDTGSGGTAVTMKPTPDGKFGIVEYTHGDLYYNYGMGNSWHSSLIDSDVHGDNRSNWALDYDPVSGTPYVAYQSNGGGQYIAHYTGSRWFREQVTGTSSTSGCGLAFDPGTNSPVVVFDTGSGLEYARKD